ncbi:MAG: hypothetical protein EOO40_11570, partial [Deltaproteobacteria bacterium]
MALTSLAPSTSPRSLALQPPSLTDEVLARLGARGLDLAAVFKLLSDLQDDLRAEERKLAARRESTAGGPDAPAAAPQAPDGQSQLNEGGDQVGRLQLRLSGAKEQLEEVSTALQQMQSIELPAAQAKDAHEAVEAMEMQRRRLEEDLECLRQARKKQRLQHAQEHRFVR